MKPSEEPVSAFTMYENTNGNTTNGNKSKIKKNNKKSKKNANKSVNLHSESFKKLSTDEMITQILSKEHKKRKISDTQEASASPVITKTTTKSNEPVKKKSKPAIKIHPKDPNRLSYYMSTNKRGKKKENASTVPPVTKKKHTTRAASEGIAHSTPKQKKKHSQTMPIISGDISIKNEKNGSIEAGENLFSWIINPMQLSNFMNNFWERDPVLIDRKCSTYYEDILSTNAIDKMLRENRIEFTKNIDITSYKNGVRETHNPDGRAMPPTVWDFYRQGCSIRILNPQTYIPSVHSLNATLQEYFQCMTGANVYLTPPNSQGFAPHYDDIEAFILQVEGKKHWKVYKPRTKQENLPRVSSGNFDQSEIGKPILDVTLEAGDFLYFPRGFIHQATTVPGCHSLHITLSVYQKHTYGDLMEVLMPLALEKAINEDVSLRQGLPLNIWQCMGLVNSDSQSIERTTILGKIKKCFDRLFTDAPVDDAVDQMALRYQHDALPPYLTDSEELRTVFKTPAKLLDDGDIDHPIIEIDTKIRLLRANILRLVRDKEVNGSFRIYFNSENSKEYHELEPNFIGIDCENAPAVEVLIKSYPDYITPAELQLASDESCLAVAQDLWEHGMLMTEEILK